MAAVNRLTVDGGIAADNPTWKEVKAEFIALEQANEPATLSLLIGETWDAKAFAITSFDPRLGFYLVIHQEDEDANYQLIQSPLGGALVQGIVGGLPDSYPRLAFVDRVAALAALREFHAHGRRARHLEWMDELEVVSKYLVK